MGIFSNLDLKIRLGFLNMRPIVRWLLLVITVTIVILGGNLIYQSTKKVYHPEMIEDCGKDPGLSMVYYLCDYDRYITRPETYYDAIIYLLLALAVSGLGLIMLIVPALRTVSRSEKYVLAVALLVVLVLAVLYRARLKDGVLSLWRTLDPYYY